jgi:hypothetical protein
VSVGFFDARAQVAGKPRAPSPPSRPLAPPRATTRGPEAFVRRPRANPPADPSFSARPPIHPPIIRGSAIEMSIGDVVRCTCLLVLFRLGLAFRIRCTADAINVSALERVYGARAHSHTHSYETQPSLHLALCQHKLGFILNEK